MPTSFPFPAAFPAHLEAFAMQCAQPPLTAATFTGPSILCTWHELKRAGQGAWTALRYQLIPVPLFYSWRNREGRWLAWGCPASLPQNQKAWSGPACPPCGAQRPWGPERAQPESGIPSCLPAALQGLGDGDVTMPGLSGNHKTDLLVPFWFRFHSSIACMIW